MSSAQPFALTDEQIAFFHREGYLIIPDFFTAEEADRLRAHANKLVDQLDLSTHPGTVFKSSTEGPQTSNSYAPAANSNQYFLDSADNISYFFEEHAWENGELKVSKLQSVNKIGHALHELDPLFGPFSTSEKVRAVSRGVGMTAPAILQSMVIFKQPKIGGKVDIHRDHTFLFTEPASTTGLWFALEDCTMANGCLKFLPGSHKDGLCNKKMVRRGGANDPTNRNKDVDLVFTGEEKSTVPESEYVAGPVKKGTLVLIHGDILHMSSPNTSPDSRNIYTFHMIETHNTTYSAENWLQSSRPLVHLFSPEEEQAYIKSKQQQ